MTNDQTIDKLCAECLARFEGRDYDPDGPPMWAWHIHHTELVEVLIEPVASRVAWICDSKDPAEIPRRLERLRPVLGELPEAVAEAGRGLIEAVKVCRAAREAHEAYIIKACNGNRIPPNEIWKVLGEPTRRYRYSEALTALDKAGWAYDKAREAHAKELEALHTVECPNCPWDGKRLVFPESLDEDA